MSDATTKSVRSIEWLTFFLADVQTGLGPFLAAYLAASGWNPGSVGYVLTFGGLNSVAMQTPAGAVIDATHRKRALMAISLAVLVAGVGHLSLTEVYSAQFFGTAFLFHMANAAMLPELGETLSKSSPRAAAPFMSACVIVTQLAISFSAAWIGKRAVTKGRKPLLLLGFGVLPTRRVNANMSKSLNFAFLPDHDVHSGSYANFLNSLMPQSFYKLAVRVADRKQMENILRRPLDKEDVVAPWPEHGPLGTQLGPNKNGRKW